jgi:hypothetical protein
MASIEKKLKEVQDKDKKDDLEITLNNTKLLKHNAWILLHRPKRKMRQNSLFFLIM